MDKDIETAVRAIHDSATQCVLYLTGGGSRALSWLLCVPGASRTVLEAAVPYSEASLVELLGDRPDHAMSAEVAAALATCAHARALDLQEHCTVEQLCNVLEPPDSVSGGGGCEAWRRAVGLGCTAGLATDRPRRGPHRCYVGVCDEEGVGVQSLTLAKGARTRDEEEEVVARWLLAQLATACGCPAELDLGLLRGDAIEDESVDA